MERWLTIFIIAVAIGLAIYAIKTFSSERDAEQIKSNQDYIIQSLNKSEEARQQNKIVILNNISGEIKKVRADLADAKEDAHTNRLILEKLIEGQNLTVSFGNSTHPIGSIIDHPPQK